MYSFEHIVKGSIDLQKAWAFYSDVSHWSEWDSDVESVILQGLPFGRGRLKKRFVSMNLHIPNMLSWRL